MAPQREILTIGYEGSDVVDFVALLSSLDVEVLCDVRDVTASRKKGFSKNPLTEALATAGIKYLHFKGLGDPREGRLAARAGDFGEFRRIFGRHLSSEQAQLALVKLSEVVSNQRSCLMCFERDPKECHRSIVADTLATDLGYNIRHVGVPKGFALERNIGRSEPKEPCHDNR